MWLYMYRRLYSPFKPLPVSDDQEKKKRKQKKQMKKETEKDGIDQNK
jgi:hypothetical protein